MGSAGSEQLHPALFAKFRRRASAEQWFLFGWASILLSSFSGEALMLTDDLSRVIIPVWEIPSALRSHANHKQVESSLWLVRL